MGRNILFVTTDQQRYDALGCNGGSIARTPIVDELARTGIIYRRAYNQNTVCMPARCTMLTGQYPRTHGVVANGVALPTDAPSVAGYLAEKAGYRTALIGKAHFEPGFDPGNRWEENARAARGDTGPWRGFEHALNAVHVAAFRGRALSHYGRWLAAHHPEHLESFASLLGAEPGGDSGAPETKHNGLERTWGDGVLNLCGVHYDGSEGELYRVDEDPYQWHNRWDDASCRSVRSDLVADLYDSLPTERRELPVDAPA